VNRKHLGHVIAAVLMGHRRRPLDAKELEALRERCRTAELLELGHLLFESTDKAGSEVIADEINRRLGEHKEP
jgi:hypothetical protein